LLSLASGAQPRKHAARGGVARALLTTFADSFLADAVMTSVIDKHLGVHAQALTLRSQRTELLAANLANADTPGYRARDIDFKTALAQASGTAHQGVHLQTTNAAHIGPPNSIDGGVNGAPAPELKYRTPLAPSLDGNTVDAQLEQAAFAENTVRYQATLQFLNSKFRGLMTAITGQ
jgi:flagellar basal-body rod protein FlgB